MSDGPRDTFSVIGRPQRKIDGLAKSTGRAAYTDDLVLPGMLHGKILRSPHPHARIVSIDVSAAEALPGVHGVVTGADLPTAYGIIPWTPDETALAVDRVRYVGDGVAAVAAVDEDTAVEALGLIRVEYEILPAVRDMNLGVMVWSPLAGGYLSGKYTDDGDKKGRRAAFEFPPVGERADQIVGVLREIANAHDASPARIALAWLLYQEGVTSVIIGARKMDQLEDNLKAVDVELSADELARLDEVSAPPVLYPNWMPALPRGTTMADALANLS